MKYEFLDLTSDVMFRAYGRDEKELLESAAEAMFSVICNIKSVQPKKKIKIEATSEDLEGLLYDWLSTLLTQSEIEEMFFSKFHIDGIKRADNKLMLKGHAMGEESSVEKGNTLVKGVTYYGLKIEKTERGLSATVSLDI